MKNRYILFLGLIGLLFSCKPEIEDFDYSKGEADFTTYVALGNSMTAGYADGALYRSAQINSYPAILAEQFKKVGGGNFVQPLMNGEYGIKVGKLKLGYKPNCVGDTSLSPVPDLGELDQPLPVGYSVNNLGVPGAKALHLVVPGYANLNPYFGRFASSPGTSVINDAINIHPTFFTLWIGNNDILEYAAAGGNGWITNTDSLQGIIGYMLDTLTATGAKGAIANIPDIMSAPYFTVMSAKIPYNGLVLTDQQDVDALNAAYQPLGITFALGQNPFIVEDAITHFPRQMKPTDQFLLTLPSDSLLCYGFGSAIKIPHKYVLDENEIAKITTAIGEYNQVIYNLTTLYNLAFVDIYQLTQDLKVGIITDGIKLTGDFVTGNAFSLDGIHLTQMGYAYVANHFIMSINENYNSNIPTVSLTQYQSVILP
jgi:lysophospholipase L1-like esterase